MDSCVGGASFCGYVKKYRCVVRVLIVCSHPDDEVLLCGGYAKRLSIENHIVKTLILSEGALSREDSDDDDVKTLKTETAAANVCLGIWKTQTLGYPDNQFDMATLLAITQDIEDVMEDFQPDMVITHSGVDLNNDHKMTHEAVKIATRPQSGVQIVLAGEVLSSTECNNIPFNPTYFVDISSTIDAKLEAMKCYKSELREHPHPRSLKGIKALSEYRGTQCNKENAEAFEVIRMIV